MPTSTEYRLRKKSRPENVGPYCTLKLSLAEIYPQRKTE